MLTLYTYKQCGSCQKAVKFLKAHGIAFTEVPIREQPPSLEALNSMLATYKGELKKLFNVSGGDYRALDLKNKLAHLSTDDALALLQSNGNLVKRPFVLSPSFNCVGFNEEQWSSLL